MDSLDQMVSTSDPSHYQLQLNQSMLFSAGKYTSSSFLEDSIPAHATQAQTQATIDANKKLEEITPLLHQASISSPNNADNDGERSSNAASSSNRNGVNKASYRKRVKTKLSRKTA